MISPRRIAHLDMDAFFASVELLRHPQLRGQPVVVGGRGDWEPRQHSDGTWQYARLRDYRGRGVVTTSTYEARALGVFSAMGMMQAARLAPDAVLLPAHFEDYRAYSARFKAAVARIAPRIEDRGIDEIYLDLSDLSGSAEDLGRQLKQAVWDATGLRCSIGISPNKLLSKIASDLDKPDGLTVIGWDDVERRIWPLPASRINGVGPKSAAKLAALGIATIADLARADPGVLQEHFGSHEAAWLHDVAHGRDARDLVTQSRPKSLSRESTFVRDLDVRLDRQELSRHFTALCEKVAADLQRKQLLCGGVGLKLRFEDFRTVTRDQALRELTGDPGQIRLAAGACLKRIALDRRIRLLGVRVWDLQPVASRLAVQTSLPFSASEGPAGEPSTIPQHQHGTEGP